MVSGGEKVSFLQKWKYTESQVVKWQNINTCRIAWTV